MFSPSLEFLEPLHGQSGRSFGVSVISKERKYGLQIITSHFTEDTDEIPFVFANITR